MLLKKLLYRAAFFLCKVEYQLIVVSDRIVVPLPIFMVGILIFMLRIFSRIPLKQKATSCGLRINTHMKTAVHAFPAGTPQHFYLALVTSRPIH